MRAMLQVVTVAPVLLGAANVAEARTASISNQGHDSTSMPANAARKRYPLCVNTVTHGLTVDMESNSTPPAKPPDMVKSYASLVTPFAHYCADPFAAINCLACHNSD